MYLCFKWLLRLTIWIYSTYLGIPSDTQGFIPSEMIGDLLPKIEKSEPPFLAVNCYID